MSNSNNIYNILNKLEALKPTPEEKRMSLVKEIQESIDAQQPVAEGVDAIQVKLAKQFAESKIEEKAVSTAQQKFMGMVHAAQKGEKAASPEVAKVAKSMGKQDAKDFAATKHKGLPSHVEEAGKVCAECGMTEGECEHTMSEAEITRTDGKTVHRKTDFPGYPVDEPEDIEDTNKGKRGRPRKHAAKAPTGLGRGRPVKAKAPTFSKQADPFGRVSGAVPKGTKGTVHSMAESMDLLDQQLNTMLSEGRYLEDAGKESFNHILNRFRAEVKQFEQGGDLDEDLYDALYDYYVECGEMPYGVQKARDADPMEWVAGKLGAELGDIAYGKDPANAEGAMEAGIPGNVPTDQIPGKEDLLKGKGRSYYEEEVTMEDELNELARLAGLNTTEGNAFTGKLASTPKGGEFELDGKTFKDTSSLDEEDDMEEGNEFSGELAKAKAQHKTEFKVDGKTYPVKESTSFDAGDSSDFNISTSMSSDGDKNVTVTATGEHAAHLLQMLRIAGLGGGQAAQDLEQQQQPELVVIGDEPEAMDEEGIEVDQPVVEPANAPDETYGSIKNITTQGDDLNREKSQDPATANKAANPLTNAQKTLKAVAQLESKLAAEYESIKKISK